MHKVLKRLGITLLVVIPFSLLVMMGIQQSRTEEHNQVQTESTGKIVGTNKPSDNKENGKDNGNNVSQKNTGDAEQSKDNNKANGGKTDSGKTSDEKTNSETVSPSKPSTPKKTSYALNDKGDEVANIQKKLNQYGYSITVDGVYGYETYYAVKDFQLRTGLNPDGVAGKAVIAKLDSAKNDKAAYKPKTNIGNGLTDVEKFINSQDASSKTSYYIFVDTKKFKVNIFQGSNKNWRLVRSMSCSIGKDSTPTVKGHFTVGSKGKMFRADGNIVCKYFTQFHGGYLFHSVLLNNNGKVVDGRLGKRISHGCVRLAIEDAKYIFDNIPPGTAVWVK